MSKKMPPLPEDPSDPLHLSPLNYRIAPNDGQKVAYVKRPPGFDDKKWGVISEQLTPAQQKQLRSCLPEKCELYAAAPVAMYDGGGPYWTFKGTGVVTLNSYHGEYSLVVFDLWTQQNLYCCTIHHNMEWRIGNTPTLTNNFQIYEQASQLNLQGLYFGDDKEARGYAHFFHQQMRKLQESQTVVGSIKHNIVKPIITGVKRINKALSKDKIKDEKKDEEKSPAQTAGAAASGAGAPASEGAAGGKVESQEHRLWTGRAIPQTIDSPNVYLDIRLDLPSLEFLAQHNPRDALIKPEDKASKTAQEAQKKSPASPQPVVGGKKAALP